jgi:pimeloyl-ACP methyl ester carboxylesterase
MSCPRVRWRLRCFGFRKRSEQLTVIEDAGHIPHIDQPDAVAAAINQFVRRDFSGAIELSAR